MKALVLKEVGQYPALSDWPDPNPESSDLVSVKVLACSLNHRDLWIIQGKYPGIHPPVIMGSDAVGEIEGKRVVIQPGLNWGDNPEVQGPDYQILGVPGHGVFADFAIVPKENVFPAPEHLTDEEAAALPLAGLTAFRVLFTKCKVQAGERLLVTGVGGGVALHCVLFGVAAGLEVWVTSGSEEKIQKALALGAKGGVNYNDDAWAKDLKKSVGSFDVIIDSAGGEGFSNLITLAAPAGRIGIYGGGQGLLGGLSPQLIFWRQLKIFGSTMGTPAEFANMLEFVSEHELRPVVDSVWEKTEYLGAFKRMEEAKQFGKIVLRWA
ncbi:MAG: putative zinc-type alcohol dehydrogenase-like protein YogA [Saprospiraceae bacterium]|nr:MAG: putative zinc-type alcohol dehydrogenase-like protein YogA [Saprospiraceae bacterium]